MSVLGDKAEMGKTSVAPGAGKRNGPFPHVNSLLRLRKSLFARIFSLLTFLGNCLRSDCSTAGSCYESGSWRSETAKFPVKFPVSREFSRRRVRSALRRQPTSPALREAVPNSRRNARQQRAFLIQRAVSSLPSSPAGGRNCRKSLATCRNIPVSGRRRVETGFDLHCVPERRFYFVH